MPSFSGDCFKIIVIWQPRFRANTQTLPLSIVPSLSISANYLFSRDVLKIAILAERHSDFRPQEQPTPRGEGASSFIREGGGREGDDLALDPVRRGRFNYAMKCSRVEAEYQ